MPKISVHGGPTNERAEPGEPGYVDPAVDAGGEEESSPGSSSETSHEKPQTSDEKPQADPPKRARTTGSRSKRAAQGDSTAGSTGGRGRRGT